MATIAHPIRFHSVCRRLFRSSLNINEVNVDEKKWTKIDSLSLRKILYRYNWRLRHDSKSFSSVTADNRLIFGRSILVTTLVRQPMNYAMKCINKPNKNIINSFSTEDKWISACQRANYQILQEAGKTKCVREKLAIYQSAPFEMLSITKLIVSQFIIICLAVQPNSICRRSVWTHSRIHTPINYHRWTYVCKFKCLPTTLSEPTSGANTIATYAHGTHHMDEHHHHSSSVVSTTKVTTRRGNRLTSPIITHEPHDWQIMFFHPKQCLHALTWIRGRITIPVGSLFVEQIIYSVCFRARQSSNLCPKCRNVIRP